MDAVLTIRPYEPEDLKSVVALWEACELTRPWNDPASDIDFCQRSENSALFVGVPDKDDQVVATVMAGHDGHRGWIYYLAIAPELRKSGAGRAMMQHAEQWLAAKGVPKAMLLIRETNHQVIGFYRR